MREWESDCVDLIYLDPPFNSNANYNVLFGEKGDGKAQYRAFNDTWSWDAAAVERYANFENAPGRPAHDAIVGLRRILGGCGMLAYLTYMAERLEEMRRLLKSTGSIYLHCDPSASHYLKIVMDAIFDKGNFRNEIVWVRDPAGKGAKRTSRQWPRNYDEILMYSKSDRHIFKQQYTALSESQKKAYRYEDARGRYKAVQKGDYSDASMARFRSEDKVHTSKTGKEYIKYYLHEAKAALGSVWTDIYGFGTKTASKERLGYPTQKTAGAVRAHY